ncbi:hypothetical protein BN1058_00851 [Paraliobacillus sp. PM-2]|nr:hypothetical protein BN1058_00851 [Paraliobacillus sp. PM-2]
MDDLVSGDISEADSLDNYEKDILADFSYKALTEINSKKGTAINTRVFFVKSNTDAFL